MVGLSHESVLERVEWCLARDDGFEVYPFRIGSYNSVVSSDFTLDYPSNSLALLIVSTPKMFDVAYKRWIREETKKAGSFDAFREEMSSPISEFMDSRLDSVQEELSSVPFDIIHDHSMWPNRKPKILMCTCGHVAGAAYYYRQSDPTLSETKEGKKWDPKPAAANLKFIGLSLHSDYGGHFAFRSVLIFPDIILPSSFHEGEPVSVLHTIDEIRDALEKFNYAWRDSRFRDCGSPKERYSDIQMEYFGKPPAERWEVIRHWTEEEQNEK
ncbi:hypothetical protein PENTCL1PPCAC_6364 [Pristionchus entomophagus]|uniref:Cyanocobalamin reductase (cyanide-eliminating) n=1 Tax=Pristionchus entomophagus TaxID=358040 RepID=A0AAV5SVC6_9BILA|nr:hypothetical protein PENTCL1PPCAC_6364 [Pristionchus entomophagus]